MSKIRRIAAIGVMTATFALVASPAFANWTSYMSAAPTGFESRRWADEDYSQVQFTDCVDENDDPSVTVELWEDISFLPDESAGTNTLTKCFKGAGYTSNGVWNGLESGNWYFELKKLGSGSGTGLLDVGTVYVDTTEAD